MTCGLVATVVPMPSTFAAQVESFIDRKTNSVHLNPQLSREIVPMASTSTGVSLL